MEPLDLGGPHFLGGHKPHIILVGGDGHPSGVPRHITDLVRALTGLARITVVSEVDAGGYGQLAELGARHVVLPGLASRLHPAKVRAGNQALCALLQDEAPDVVWFHARLPVMLGRQLLVSTGWKPPAGTRVAVTYHGLPFGRGHRPSVGWISKQIERRLLRKCPPLDLVFLNEAQQQRMQNSMGKCMLHHRLHVLGNSSCLGTQLTQSAIDTQKPVQGRHLVMTGRTGWQKNYKSALRLMRHLPEDITLSMCGRGSDSPAFLALVKKLAGPAADRVRCLGSLPDIRAVLASADGYMLSSRYEGLPIGALEACETGLPLILGDFEGAGQLLSGLPIGLRLSEKTPHKQAQKIDAMLQKYLSNRTALSTAIKAHWAANWAPDVFDGHAKSLVSNWLADFQGLAK